jgi:hypothetical protein
MLITTQKCWIARSIANRDTSFSASDQYRPDAANYPAAAALSILA